MQNRRQPLFQTVFILCLSFKCTCNTWQPNQICTKICVTEVTLYRGSFLNAGQKTTERAALSVAGQRGCRPLYGAQSTSEVKKS